MAQTTEGDLLTAYAVAKLTNKVLEAKNLKAIREQLVYRYMDQGSIPFVEVEETGADGEVKTVKRITSEDAVDFVRKYVTGRFTRSSSSDDLVNQVLEQIGADEASAA